VKKETALGLYKGLGAVLTGIVPKMAIRFTSYEWYKQLLADENGAVSGKATFLGKPNPHHTNPMSTSEYLGTLGTRFRTLFLRRVMVWVYRNVKLS
jgi:hypothetical protein